MIIEKFYINKFRFAKEKSIKKKRKKEKNAHLMETFACSGYNSSFIYNIEFFHPFIKYEMISIAI